MPPRTPPARRSSPPGPPLRLAVALAAAFSLAACFTDLGHHATDTATTGTSTTSGVTTGPGPVCGDGVVEPPESCDLGPLNGDYGACRADCTPAVCGDGLLAPAEACDDENDPDDTCMPGCTLPRCGDGFVSGVEQCDDGNLDENDECASTCRASGCGDGVVQDGEACDHGPLNADGAGCTSKCQLAVCGDGLIGPGEACEPGNVDTCTEDCALASCVGNIDPEPDEQCQVADPGCTDRCLLNVCGDGFKVESEACDDGNLFNGDGCSAACLREECGDGVRAEIEACDDNNLDDGDGCSSTCQRDAHFIFVTEEKHTGVLGDLKAADKKCQDSANAKMLPGTYRAWISFPGDPPATRLKKSSVPYILPVSHEVVAADWVALVSGTLAHPINRTAGGTEVLGGASCSAADNLAWTHTRANAGPADGNPCSAWISSSETAVAGLVHATDIAWTEGCPDVKCEQALRLYCVEQ